MSASNIIKAWSGLPYWKQRRRLPRPDSLGKVRRASPEAFADFVIKSVTKREIDDMLNEHIEFWASSPHYLAAHMDIESLLEKPGWNRKTVTGNPNHCTKCYRPVKPCSCLSLGVVSLCVCWRTP